jgi:hypothetical protein
MERVSTILAGLAGAAVLALGLAAVPAAAQQAQRQAPGFTLKNEGDIAVFELYVARGGTGARNWGPDRFGSEILPAGRSFQVRLPGGFGCSADIRLVFEDGEEEVRERVDICREREVVVARSAPPAAPEREVEIVNAGPRTIMYLYIRPAGGEDWQEDRLGSSTFEPGTRFTAQVPDQGCGYDIRVEYDNDAAEERRNVDLCAVAPLTIGPGWTVAEDLAGFSPGAVGAPGMPGPATAGSRVTLVNRSGRTVFTLHVFPDGARDEGEDRLGASTLSDGDRIEVPLDTAQGCSFTVRLTYDDGEREERAGIDLCRAGELVIEAGWVDAAMAGAARLVNAGPAPIIALYADPPGAARGPDRLGENVLGVGRSLSLAPPQEGVCAYDVTARFRNGAEARVAGADLCAGGEIRLAP